MLGNHLLGLYEKALDPNDDWANRLRKIKILGFDFVEICIDEQDSRIERLYWSPEMIESLRRTIYDAKVPILSMCLSAHRRYPFGSADPKIRQKAYDLMEKAISFSVSLGIRVIQLAGYDVYYEKSTHESRAFFLEGLRWSVSEAARHQVMLAMEIMDTSLINSISNYLEYKKLIKSPWFMVYPDLGNLSAWGNNVQKELEVGINDIVGIHVKETKAVTEDFPGQFKNVPFGEGCVKFSDCFTWLGRLKYSGPYLIEMWHEEGKDDMKTVADAKVFIEKQYYSSNPNKGKGL